MVKNQNKKRIGLLVLLSVVLIAAFSMFTVSAASMAVDEVNLQIDVMFVIDGSGSMLDTDPTYIATQACNMFTSLCNANQARAGFVVYSSVIVKEQPLTALNTEDNRLSLKSQIENIVYPEQGGTDISLGLTRATELLRTGGGLEEGRAPMIILLSDGEIRDVAETRINTHEGELQETLRFLRNPSNDPDKEIPVYTIGLGENKPRAQVDTLTEIAGGENRYKDVQSAYDLPRVLGEIMADRLGVDLDERFDGTATGEPQEVVISIPGGVKQANIIIMSNGEIRDVELFDNDNVFVAFDPRSNRKLEQDDNCTTITLIDPESGDWRLVFTGTAGDRVSIHLLNTANVKFRLTCDKTANNVTEIKNGNQAGFTVAGVDTDPEAFEDADGILTITNTATLDGAPTLPVKTVDLKNNGTYLTASNIFDKAGTYEVVGEIVKDGSYNRSTNVLEIKVNPTPLKLKNSGTEETLFSPILGFLKINNTTEISIGDIATFDKDAKITVTPSNSGWQDVCEYKYDPAAKKLTITAVGGGDADMNFTISDGLGGNNVQYKITVSVIPGWLFALGVLIIIVIIVVIIIIIKKVRTPRLSGRLKLSVSLPTELASMTPPEAEIDLSILNKKGKASITAVLASNLTLSGMYTQALSGIADFVSKLIIEPADRDCSSLNLYIPAPANGVTVQFNNAPIEKKAKKAISSGMPVVISHTSFSSAYTLTFNFGESGWMSGGDGVFGAGTVGGFGGFGGEGSSAFGGGFGSNDGGAAPFGGGFGSNDGGAAPFGGGFGESNASAPFGDSTNNGGFGGFDSGNNGGNSTNNGGFGGFGSGDDNGFNAF